MNRDNMKKAFELFMVGVIMTGLALVSTFPLAKNFTTAIPWAAFKEDLQWSLLYRPGDHLQLFYFFWLVKQNILCRVPFNGNPYEFNMLGGQTAGNDGFTTAPLAFISFLFSPLGDIAAYNCTVISSYVLAGVFMYLLAKIFTGSRFAALLAALIFTFVPIRIIGMAGGQQFGFVLFFYPMIFYFMEKCLRTQKKRYGFLAGLGILGLSFNEPHLIYYFFMCLAGYLPIRFISLIPMNNGAFHLVPSFHLRKIMSWPLWLSLLIIWGSGIGLVLCAHFVLPLRYYETFFSLEFWCMVGYYPLIILFLSVLFGFVYIHLSSEISARKALSIEAGSMLPLYLLLPLTFLLDPKELDAATAIVVAVSVVMVIKVWLLKPYLAGMVEHVWKHAKNMKGLFVGISPALIGMAVTVILTLITKTKSISSSTESGGRTIHDIKLYSAHLQDVFISTSPVYTGLLPISFGILFLCFLVYTLARQDNFHRKCDVNLTLYAYVGVVLLISQVLALGLALGNRSLYLLFYNYVPFFNVPRVSDRILCVAILAFSCITAGVASALISRFPSRFWRVGCSLVLLLLTAFQLKTYGVNVRMAITDLYPMEETYRYIKDNIGDGVLLELPLWPGDSHQSSLYEYFTTLDEIKRVNGYTPLVSREYLRTVFSPLHSLDRGELHENQYNLLRKLNVKYITIHEHVDIFPPKVSPFPPATTVRRLTNSPFLEHIGSWNIWNHRYDKLHEQLNVFRVKDAVVEGVQDTYYEMPKIYRVGSSLRQKTGKVEFDKAIGREVYNAAPGKDKPDFMIYGPYESFFAGKYKCNFRMKLSGGINGESGARIDVVRFDKNGLDILTEVEVKTMTSDERYNDYYVDFELPERSQLEFRVFYYGTAEVSVDKIVVGKIDNALLHGVLEAEMMVGETGRIVQAEEASGRKVIEARPGKDKRGRIVYGPDMKYDNGRYSAIFHLKRLVAETSAIINDSAEAAVISITGNQGNTVFAREAIKSFHLQDDAFKEIRLDFVVPEPEEVSFEVFYTNKLAIQLDKIEIIKNIADQ